MPDSQQKYCYFLRLSVPDSALDMSEALFLLLPVFFFLGGGHTPWHENLPDQAPNLCHLQWNHGVFYWTAREFPGIISSDPLYSLLSTMISPFSRCGNRGLERIGLHL